ncbi:MAG TPA: cell division protein FtsL [Myxococcales bacterium]|jgi:cell division protein FtsL
MSMTQSLASQSTIRRAVDRRGLLDFATATLACSFIALAALGHAYLRTRVTEEGYRLSRLSAESRELAREHEALQIRAAELKSPQRIEELARTKLGMAPPPLDRVVVLVGDSVRPTVLAAGR